MRHGFLPGTGGDDRGADTGTGRTRFRSSIVRPYLRKTKPAKENVPRRLVGERPDRRSRSGRTGTGLRIEDLGRKMSFPPFPGPGGCFAPPEWATAGRARVIVRAICAEGKGRNRQNTPEVLNCPMATATCRDRRSQEGGDGRTNLLKVRTLAFRPGPVP